MGPERKILSTPTVFPHKKISHAQLSVDRRNGWWSASLRRIGIATRDGWYRTGLPPRPISAERQPGGAHAETVSAAFGPSSEGGRFVPPRRIGKKRDRQHRRFEGAV